MKPGLICIALLSSLLSASLSAEERGLGSRDFAYGIPLEVDGDGAIYSLSLPEDVYRFTVRNDLGDVRIFNGYGEVVPHLLQRDHAILEKKHEPVPLRFFPLYGDESWEEEVKYIRIADDGQGTIIDIERPPWAAERKPGAVAHYLIDASALDAPIEKLMLDWDEVGDGFLVSVKLEYSNDLVHWHHLIHEATLADLTHQGYRLRQQSIVLPRQEARYYRVSWPLGGKGLLLNSVNAVVVRAAERRSHQWLPLLPESAVTQEGVYHFTSPGRYPVDRIRVSLPQSNTVVRVRLYSRSDEGEAPWGLHYQGLLYSLEREGQTLKNEDIVLTGGSDKHWRLEVVTDGGGLGSGRPQLQVGWVPHRLLFVARGEMPFTLAFGSAEADAPGSTMAALVKRLESQGEGSGFIKLAHPGGLFELGGKSRLEPPKPPLPWQQWLLWAVLVLGVLLLAWMGRTLYRQMNP